MGVWGRDARSVPGKPDLLPVRALRVGKPISCNSDVVLQVDMDQRRSADTDYRGREEWSIVMKVKNVMTSPVVSIEPESAVLEAVRIMLQRHISGLPVVDKEGRLIGIVTEGDFLRRAETGTQRRRPRWLEYLVGPGRRADE